MLFRGVRARGASRASTRSAFFFARALLLTAFFFRYGEDFVDLMEHLLVLDPRKRLTAVEALDHQWFWTEPYPTDPKL